MLVPFGTVLNAAAVDASLAESYSNTALADYSAESVAGAGITGKVDVTFTFNGDGVAVLTQNGSEIARVDISADGTYSFDSLAAGSYNLLISIPGWTEYNVYDISVSEDEQVEILESTVIAGDADNSGEINISDIALVLTNMGKASDDENKGCDINHDGLVDIADVTNIVTEQNFLEKAYSSYFINNGYTDTY